MASNPSGREAEELAANVIETSSQAGMIRTARRVFLGSLLYTSGLTVFWAILLIVRPDHIPFFKTYRIDRDAVTGILGYFIIGILIWGFLWYGIRLLLLRKFVKMSKEDAREVFNSRMRRPFDLARYRALYDERRIRITDMIGRRGRFITLGILLFYGTYVRIETTQDPAHFALGMGDMASWPAPSSGRSPASWTVCSAASVDTQNRPLMDT